MKKLLPLFLILFTGAGAFAQYYQTGQDPASIRWRQINTRTFQLIFPDYYEEQAKILAGKLEVAYPYASYTLRHNPKKIPVILHTQTVQSNGVVAWAPKRAEFFTTPHQSIYPQDWLEQLALHEFRHVVQVDKIQHNLPFWARFLLGEQGTALAFGAYLPWWFIEGDAVITETALSNYGRGRFPSFLMEHKAQVVEKGVFSYDKAFFRSYRDFVPNHYKLGYYLAGNLRVRHGSELWEEVLTRAGSKPLSIFPMKQVLKNKTGLNIEQSYRSVFDSLQAVWVSADTEYHSIPYSTATSKSRFYTNYIHNHWLNDSVLISYKTAYDEIPAFVKINVRQKEEERIVFPGTVFGESVGYNNEWIIWSEQIRDIRWQHSGRSLLRAINVNTGKRIEIKPEFKCLSPVISPDRMKVAVVETDFSSNHYLSVYQLHDGSLLHRYQSPGNNYFFSPEWLNNEEVAAVMLTRNGKQIVRVNFPARSLESLQEVELGDIKHLRHSGDHLYFIGTYSGKNSLYKHNLISNTVERVYEPRFGVESPAISADGTRIALSDYTADGYRLIEISAANESVVPIDEIKPHKYILADILASQEAGFPVFSDTITGEYEVEPYKKAGNLFNFHSWGPVYVDIESYEFQPGVSLMSQNILGTSETILGYQWDLTESTGKFIANYSYKGWYPVFDVEVSHGQRASNYNLIRQEQDGQGVVRQDTVSQRFTWGETTAGLKMKMPLIFDKGPYNRLLQPELQYGFNYFSHNESTPHRFHQGSFHSLTYRLYLHQLRRSSYLDVFPDFGFIADGVYRHSPAGGIRAGTMKAVQSIVYLPGLMKNHGIRLYSGAQEKESAGTMGFGDAVRYARGWGRISTSSIATGGIDYKLPLLYPDWRLGGFLYTRRINASLFADYTRLKGHFYSNGNITGNWIKDISSAGTELTAQVNVLRIYAPATIGVRASYLPELRNVYYDFLFSIDFTSF